MLNYFLDELEKDIDRCNKVIKFNSFADYQIRNGTNIDNYEDVRDIKIDYICKEMLVIYDEDIYFSSNDYLNVECFDLSCLKLMTKLMEKHRNSILDKNLVEQLNKDIKLYKKENNNYKERINEYKDEIKSYKDYIELLRKNLEIKNTNLININQNQNKEVSTTVNIDTKIDNILSNTRKRVLEENLEDREELLAKLNELENVMHESSSNNTRESKIKSTLSWLGTKSKNTIELFMPLLQIMLEYKLKTQ